MTMDDINDRMKENNYILSTKQLTDCWRDVAMVSI